MVPRPAPGNNCRGGPADGRARLRLPPAGGWGAARGVARVQNGRSHRRNAMTGLSEEQRMMRQSCRDFVDDVVIPFIRGNWQREWDMRPEARLPPEILEGAQKVGIRTLGVPEEFGGVELDKGTEPQTFAPIAEEDAGRQSGLHG